MPRRLGTLLAACVIVFFTGVGLAAAQDTTVPTPDESSDTTFVWDLVNEPSQCIGFLPRPDCGRAPQQAGDRGGALQYAVFGILMAAVGLIGTVLVRNVVRRDRAMNEAVSASRDGSDV